MDDFAPLDRRTTRLFVDVPEIVATNLAAMARKNGVSRNLYVKQPFEAAYAARCAPTGDRALDAALRAPAIGTGAPPNPPNMGSGASVSRVESALAAEKTAALAALADASKTIGALERDLADARLRNEALARDYQSCDRNRADLLGQLTDALAAKQEAEANIAASAAERRAAPPKSDDAPLSRAEIKIVRGYAAVFLSAAEIAKETGFSLDSVKAAMERPK